MEDWKKHDLTFRYMMLSRLKQDCNYYLNYGGQNPNCLWAKDETSQIENMIALWKTFDDDEKPEWLTWGDLIYYALKMGVRFYMSPDDNVRFHTGREDDEL